MTRDKALEYMNQPVRVNYNTRSGPQTRSGTVTHITLRKMVLLAFNGKDEDFEYYIHIKDIARIYELKPKDEETHQDIPQTL